MHQAYGHFPDLPQTPEADPHACDSIANPNIVLNTIVAEAFADACEVLESADDFDMAVHDLIKEQATAHPTRPALCLLPLQTPAL